MEHIGSINCAVNLNVVAAGWPGSLADAQCLHLENIIEPELMRHNAKSMEEMKRRKEQKKQKQ